MAKQNKAAMDLWEQIFANMAKQNGRNETESAKDRCHSLTRGRERRIHLHFVLLVTLLVEIPSPLKYP